MSKSKEIYWTADGSEIHELEPHTKAKHQLLEEYLKNWIIILCANHGWKETTVTLIDGFSGGGIYKDGNQLWEGSPIRMIKMVEEGHRIVREERHKSYHKLKAKFIFIDKQQEHIDCLRKQIIDFGFGHYLESQECILICDEFRNAVDRCISETQRGHSFYFLDPFGIDDIDMNIIRDILSLKGSEILWTYMIHSLIRLLPKRELNKRIIQGILEAEGYYKEIPSNQEVTARQQYLKDQSLLLIRSKSHVKYLYPFALMKNKNTVLYYLIHLANDPKAIEVMKDCTWKYNNLEYRYHFETYGCGFRTLDYYENNLKFYDIEEENINTCFSDLYEQIIPLISSNPEGITLDSLHRQVLEKNPATFYHLVELLSQLRSASEVKIIKPDNKSFTGKNIDKKYRICIPDEQTIFDLKPYMNRKK